MEPNKKGIEDIWVRYAWALEVCASTSCPYKVYSTYFQGVREDEATLLPHRSARRTASAQSHRSW